LLSLIAVTAIPTGILFWFVAVFKNTFLRSHWKMEVN
jgi:hypothetical protein